MAILTDRCVTHVHADRYRRSLRTDHVLNTKPNEQKTARPYPVNAATRRSTRMENRKGG